MFPSVVYFIHSINNVYVSIPVSQFLPPHPKISIYFYSLLFCIEILSLNFILSIVSLVISQSVLDNAITWISFGLVCIVSCFLFCNYVISFLLMIIGFLNSGFSMINGSKIRGLRLCCFTPKRVYICFYSLMCPLDLRKSTA